MNIVNFIFKVTTGFTVNSLREAWQLVYELVGETERDNYLSDRAGYGIYIAKNNDYGIDYISDLNTRLELNFKNGSSKNIWIGSYNT